MTSPYATQAEQNLVLLQNMIPREENLYVWCYHPDGTLIASSCPEELQPFLDQSFRVLGGPGHIRDYLASAPDRPMLIGSSIGMEWAVTLEAERRMELIFLIGPVFYARPAESQVRVALQDLPFNRQMHLWVKELLSRLPSLPVLSNQVFIRYVTMIHNVLTGQRLGLEDVFRRDPGTHQPSKKEAARDRTKVYLAEQALLQKVRDGDIGYYNAFRNSSLLSTGVPVQGKDPLRQMKTSLLVFTTLVTRAAMEGGLSPEIAYSLGDSYLQSIEDSNDSGALGAIAQTMYHDFIYRVHHVKANPNYSPAVQKCCDYIELSVDRKIRTADLAALVGYAEYYLTDKFKKETGQSISSYIRRKKIDRAKVLLTTSDDSVREIAEALAFSTANFFIKSFRDIEGITPAQYRKRYHSSLKDEESD